MTRGEGEALKRDIATLTGELAVLQRDESDGRRHLEDMENRVAVLEATLGNLRQSDADVGVQMDKIVAEVQTLRGDIELARKDLERTTLSVKDILARPPLGVTTAATAPRVDEGKTATIAGTAVPTESKAHYDFAKKLYDDKKFAESVEAFDLWLSRHAAAQPELVDNAAYWKAESSFGQAALQSENKAKEKSLKQAILAYQRVIEDPKSEKNDAALYKIGLSFEQLGLKVEAAAFYEEVIAKYPKSAVVADAKKRLKAVGGSKKKNPK
jgi:TolA-binding protein